MSNTATLISALETAPGVIILGDVTIGARAVIGAGSVVTKSIPEGVLAAGNPCEAIRDIVQ